MLIFNKSAAPSEFAEFANNVAMVLKAMRTSGMADTTMGEVMVWLGQDEHEIEDEAWKEIFELDDNLLVLEVDRIVAGITNQLH